MTRKNAQPERAIQRSVIAWLRQVLPPGSMVAAIVNEQRGAGATPEARMRFGAARKASGVVTGFPDCAVIVPGHPASWIEYKAEGAYARPEQRAVHDVLRAAGHNVGVVRSIEDARDCLDAWGIPTREATGAHGLTGVRPRIVADEIPF